MIQFQQLVRLWNKAFLRFHYKSIQDSQIDPTARIKSECNVVRSSFGRYSYCGYGCWIIETNVGAFCSISHNVRIGGPAHPLNWVSTSPIFQKGKNIFRTNFATSDFNPFVRTIVGNDVWIGENAIIKAGVVIGNGAVVGTGSVVTKDVGDYEIWAGNPARFIRKRFDKDVCAKLLASEWWNWDERQLRLFGEVFQSPELFLKRLQVAK